MSGQRDQMSAVRSAELPQPVVAFLLNDCKLAPKEALVGCLRGLADEGLVRFETNDGGTPIISLGADSPRSGRALLPFEDVALARVRTRAGRLARVPLSALLSDDGDNYKDWTRRQGDELGQEAQRAGLAVKSPPRGIWRVILWLIAVSIGAVVVVHVIDWKAGDAIAGPVASVAFLSLFVPLFIRRWRLTPDGAAAADSWRRDGRGGAPCTAQGLPADSGRTVWAVDGPGGAPLPRGYAWSSLGGQWRTVRLGEVLRRPFWNTVSGFRVLLVYGLIGSFFGLMYGSVVDDFDPEGKLIAIAPAALAAVVILTVWLPAFSRHMAVPDNATFTGEVVRQQYADGGADDPDKYLVWIDDGSPTATRFDAGPALYHRASVGDAVQVSWSPRRRRLHDIEPAR